MTSYGLIGKLSTKAGKRDNMLEILSVASVMMMALEGCHLYFVAKDTEDDTLIWVTEVWDSKEAHDKALAKQDVRDLITRGMPYMAENHDSWTVEPVAGIPAES